MRSPPLLDVDEARSLSEPTPAAASVLSLLLGPTFLCKFEPSFWGSRSLVENLREDRGSAALSSHLGGMESGGAKN